MKKLLLLFILLFSLPSYAKWTLIQYEPDFASWYIDYGTFKKRGDYVYFWKMTNYKVADPIKSSKVFLQADCSILRYKTLSLWAYYGQMGTGKLQSNRDTPDAKWKYAAPGTVAEGILNTACK